MGGKSEILMFCIHLLLIHIKLCEMIFILQICNMLCSIFSSCSTANRYIKVVPTLNHHVLIWPLKIGLCFPDLACVWAPYPTPHSQSIDWLHPLFPYKEVCWNMMEDAIHWLFKLIFLWGKWVYWCFGALNTIKIVKIRNVRLDLDLSMLYMVLR